MKKIILLVILFLGAKSFAQTNGITYQAVILNPSGEQLPGVNNTNAPMVDKSICMQFQFIDEFSKVEYQETVKTMTDAFGMVNLVIGSGDQTGGYAASFESMEWNALKKSLVVSINTDGSCSLFIEISDQPFTAVPFAFSAINAGNVTGVVDIQNGGTNAVTVIGAKTNLGLEKVNNTSDLEKPISTATQNALNLNTDAITVEATTARDAESVLRDDLATEATTARAAENALTSNLATETTRAGLAEVANTTAISDEAIRAVKAEDLIQGDVDENQVASELADANLVTAITAVQDDVDTNQTASELADTNLGTAITVVQDDVDANEIATNNAITSVQDDVDANQTASELADTNLGIAILGETSARTDADGLQNTAITSNASAISAETSARTTSDGLQSTAIAANASAISAESLARTTGDATSAASILAETSARITLDGLQNTAITANASVILAETSARTTSDGLQNTAISDNTDAIVTETSARTTSDGLQSTAIAANASAISAESLARTTGDATNAASILAETSARTTLDGLQNTAITANASVILAETSARTTADGLQDTAITSNASAITAETSARTTAISTEALARINGDFANAALILAETSARTTADGLQNTAITANASAIAVETSARTTAISAESLARTTGDATNAASILAETSARTTLDGLQNTAINANASAILAETSARTTADGLQNTAIAANASAITAETSARTTAISAESLTRTTGDATNAASISAETSARTTSDSLQNTVIAANASAITAETSARTTAMSAESLARTTGDATNSASILAETSARTIADVIQNTSIAVNASSITAETSARTTADGLQNMAITDEAIRAGLAEVANASAIGLKEDKINKSIDGTFASNSDVLFPTEKATKTYVDARVITATTGNYVNLTTDQNVSGKKTFNDDLNVNGQIDSFFLRVNGFADIRDAIFTGSIFDVMSDATFSGMHFDVRADAMFGGNINNGGNITSNSFIKNNGLSTQFLKADGSVDSATYLTPAGTATNVSGVVAIANGGTGASTVLGAKTTLGLANVDNTSDASKPVSTAGQTALNLKEDKINRSIDGTFASNSDVLFPTEKATKTYVDAKVITATTGNFVNLTTDQNVSGKKTFNDDLNVYGQTDLSMLRVNGFADIRDAIFTGSIFDVMSDATFSGMHFDVRADAMFGGNINNGGNITSNSFIKNNGLSTQFLKADGSVDSATYLTPAGTATNVSGVVAIANGGTGASTVVGAKTTLGLANVDNTSDASKPVSTAGQTALNLKEDKINKSIDGTFASNSDVLFPTEKATKTYVDARVITATTGNYVNLTTDQNVSGKKTFNDDLNVYGQTDLSMLRVNGFADIRDAIFTGGWFDVMSDATFSGMRFDVWGDAMFGGNINNGGNITSNSFIKNNGLSTQFLKADGSIDSATYLTSAGTAANVSGVVAIANGGTGSSTVLGAKTSFGLENVDNTTDLLKPVSTAAQSALDLKADLASPTFTGTVTAPKLVIGANTYPTIDGTVNQVLTTDGSGILNWTSQVTLADLTALQNQIANLNNAVVNLQSQISQLQNSGSWSPTVISGTMSDIFANYFVVNDVVYVSGNFSNADFDGMGMYVDLNIPVSANFINASDVHGTVLGEMLFGESASGYVEAIPNSSTIRLNLAGAHMMAFGTNGSFLFSYKLPGATGSSSYAPVVTLGTGNFSDTNYIVNGNIVLVNGNFTSANLDDYGSYIDINLPISTNFVDSSDASGIISGISMNESVSGYIEGLVGTNTVRLRASGAHGMGFDTSGSFVFSYKINSANNTSTYSPTVSFGTGNFSSANYITIGKVVYATGNFTNTDFDGMGMYVDVSIPESTIFNNASDVHGSVAGITRGESASGYVEAVPNSSKVRLNVAGAHQMAIGTNGSFIFSYIKQ